jgi:5-methylcytosine-specific restriction endonuclease McrA
MIVRKRKARKKNDVQQIPDAIVSSIDSNSVSLANPRSTINITSGNSTSTQGDSTTTITQNSKNHKITNFIVYIREFDKFDDRGVEICRNHDCIEPVCKPFKKYCSNKCSKHFTKWYNSNFYWRNVRNRVLKRDNYTCQICGIQLDRKKRYNKSLKNWLECDHIIPKSYYYHLGYQFDTLDNKVRTILEFVHNGNNLRTLCYKCHKKQSVTVASNRIKLLDPLQGMD